MSRSNARFVIIIALVAMLAHVATAGWSNAPSSGAAGQRVVSSGSQRLIAQSADDVLLGVVDDAGNVQLFRADGPGSGLPGFRAGFRNPCAGTSVSRAIKTGATRAAIQYGGGYAGEYVGEKIGGDTGAVIGKLSGSLVGGAVNAGLALKNGDIVKSCG